MKIKPRILFTLISILALIASGYSQITTGTITGTVTVGHNQTGQTPDSIIEITDEGAYTVIANIEANNTTSTAVMTGNLLVNGVTFPFQVNPNISVPSGTSTLSVSVPLVIANAGNNTFAASFSNTIPNSGAGSVTYGPVELEFYADATATTVKTIAETLQTNIDELSTTLTTQGTEIDEIQTSLGNLTTTLDTIQSRLDGLDTALTGLGGDTGVQASLTGLSTSIESLNKRLETIDDQTNPTSPTNLALSIGPGLAGVLASIFISSGFDAPASAADEVLFLEE